MVDKISVEIGLDGGAEVQRQLEDIGKSGQQAFGDIQSAAEGVDLSTVTDQISNVQSAVKSAAAFEQVIQGVKKVEGAFESLGNAAAKVAARMTRSLGVIGVALRALGPLGIALGAAGGAFIKFGDDAADGINKLTAASAQLGQTPQQLDKLQKALGQVGLDPAAITAGLAKLKEALSQDFFPQDLTTGLQNFIAQLQAMPDSVERIQLAMQKFGTEGGAQLIAALRAGILTAENFTQVLAGISPVTQQQIADAAKYQAALNQLNTAWMELKTAFTPIVTPIFDFLTEQVKKFIEDLKQLRLEIAFAKGAWDVFMAGLKGQDMGEAARQAVADYRKLEEQLKKTGAAVPTKDVAALGTAATQTSQQMIRGADGVLRAEETLEQKYDRIRQRNLEASQAAAAEAATEEQAQAQKTAARQQAAQAAIEAERQIKAAIDARNAAATADALAQAYQKAGQAGAAAGLAIAQAMNTGAQATGNYLISLRGVIVLLEGVTEAAARAAQFIANLPRPAPLGGGRPAPLGGGRPDALASGGLLGGRGTGTSDSNLAWVSRGEHIMPARAVAQPGVLSFLEALRRSGGNLRGVLDGLGRFALGGLVPRTIPAFAGGGPVGSMSNVTINFPGTPPISGLRASADVVDQLQKAAALAQVRSGGRKPSRYS